MPAITDVVVREPSSIVAIVSTRLGEDSDDEPPLQRPLLALPPIPPEPIADVGAAPSFPPVPIMGIGVEKPCLLGGSSDSEADVLPISAHGGPPVVPALAHG